MKIISKIRQPLTATYYWRQSLKLCTARSHMGCGDNSSTLTLVGCEVDIQIPFSSDIPKERNHKCSNLETSRSPHVSLHTDLKSGKIFSQNIQ